MVPLGECLLGVGFAGGSGAHTTHPLPPLSPPPPCSATRCASGAVRSSSCPTPSSRAPPTTPWPSRCRRPSASSAGPIPSQLQEIGLTAMMWFLEGRFEFVISGPPYHRATCPLGPHGGGGGEGTTPSGGVYLGLAGDPLPPRESALVVCNHQSNDWAAIYCLGLRQVRP